MIMTGTWWRDSELTIIMSNTLDNSNIFINMINMTNRSLGNRLRARRDTQAKRSETNINRSDWDKQCATKASVGVLIYSNCCKWTARPPWWTQVWANTVGVTTSRLFNLPNWNFTITVNTLTPVMSFLFYCPSHSALRPPANRKWTQGAIVTNSLTPKLTVKCKQSRSLPSK